MCLKFPPSLTRSGDVFEIPAILPRGELWISVFLLWVELFSHFQVFGPAFFVFAKAVKQNVLFRFGDGMHIRRRILAFRGSL